MTNRYPWQGGGKDFGVITWFSGGEAGEQLSLAEFKGDYTELTVRGESNEYYRALRGDQVNVIVSKSKS